MSRGYKRLQKTLAARRMGGRRPPSFLQVCCTRRSPLGCLQRRHRLPLKSWIHRSGRRRLRCRNPAGGVLQDGAVTAARVGPAPPVGGAGAGRVPACAVHAAPVGVGRRPGHPRPRGEALGHDAASDGLDGQRRVVPAGRAVAAGPRRRLCHSAAGLGARQRRPVGICRPPQLQRPGARLGLRRLGQLAQRWAPLRAAGTASPGLPACV